MEEERLDTWSLKSKTLLEPMEKLSRRRLYQSSGRGVPPLDRHAAVMKVMYAFNTSERMLEFSSIVVYETP